MKKHFLVKKESGQLQAFSPQKLTTSLANAGADVHEQKAVMAEINLWLQDGISTRSIRQKAIQLLRQHRLGLAARYRLKKAMMELGPTGYPFEILVGEIFRRQGYSVEVGQTLNGQCVTHEVDVVARKGNDLHFIECKYYQHTGKNANVQVPLYIRSRVDDLIRYYKPKPAYEGVNFHGGIVTNTRFTTDAVSFGECTGLELISWDYPHGNGLKDLIDREKIFPITVLTKLLTSQKQRLLDQDIVLCCQLVDSPDVMTKLGIAENKQRHILEEIRSLCPCPEIEI